MISVSPEIILRDTEAIVIGGSAGAVLALSHLLPSLPPDYPVPILVAVHIPAEKHSSIAQLFQSTSRLTVKEAEDKEPILSGTVYFAPPDYHLLVEHDRHLSLSSDELVNYSRPSIDVLFESAADAYRD
ncbi:MAG: chemotaxis protein CheB, partial [Nitrospira sp.]